MLAVHKNEIRFGVIAAVLKLIYCKVFHTGRNIADKTGGRSLIPHKNVNQSRGIGLCHADKLGIRLSLKLV